MTEPLLPTAWARSARSDEAERQSPVQGGRSVRVAVAPVPVAAAGQDRIELDFADHIAPSPHGGRLGDDSRTLRTPFVDQILPASELVRRTVREAEDLLGRARTLAGGG